MRRASLAAGLLLLAGAAPGHATAGPAFHFEHPAAIALALHFDAWANLRIGITYAWSAVDWDGAVQVLGVQRAGGEWFRWWKVSAWSSVFGQVEVHGLGHDLAAPQPGGTGLRDAFDVDDVLAPGDWSILILAAGSHPLTSLDVAMTWDDPGARATWRVSDAVGYLTNTDLEGEPRVWVRELGLGAAAAVDGHRQVTVREALSGFSYYTVPAAGADEHVFTVSGPQGTQPADERTFDAEPPGTYDFRLQGQVSAGLHPGKVTVLWADIAP
jgi:hypothetical protein